MSQMDPVFWGRRKFFEGAPLQDRTRRKLLEKNDCSCPDENFATWFWSTCQEAPWTLIFWIIKSICKIIEISQTLNLKIENRFLLLALPLRILSAFPNLILKQFIKKLVNILFFKPMTEQFILKPDSKDERVFWEILGFLDRKETNESD